jgi:hypothetical protein
MYISIFLLLRYLLFYSHELVLMSFIQKMYDAGVSFGSDNQHHPKQISVSVHSLKVEIR